MRLLLAGIGLAAAVVLGAGFYVIHLYDVPGPLATDRAVVVPRGGIGHVAAVLMEQGVIRAGWQFEAAALATRGAGSLKSAELEFPAAASLHQVLTVLRTSKSIQHKLTIAEGLTTMQVTALFARADALDGEVPAVAEGSVLPETYVYERGTARQMLLGRASRAMDAVLDDSWSTRAPDLPLATPQEALILASIVERETAKPEERKLVAAVYLNRLRRG